MPLFGDGSSSNWTIATIIVYAIFMGLFITYISGFLGYVLATTINATSMAHRAFWETLNGTEPEVLYEGKAGNYTYIVTRPVSNPVFASILTMVMSIVPSLIIVVSDPAYLALLIATELIIIAYEIEVM